MQLHNEHCNIWHHLFSFLFSNRSKEHILEQKEEFRTSSVPQQKNAYRQVFFLTSGQALAKHSLLFFSDIISLGPTGLAQFFLLSELFLSHHLFLSPSFSSSEPTSSISYLSLHFLFFFLCFGLIMADFFITLFSTESVMKEPVDFRMLLMISLLSSKFRRPLLWSTGLLYWPSHERSLLRTPRHAAYIIMSADQSLP